MDPGQFTGKNKINTASRVREATGTASALFNNSSVTAGMSIRNGIFPFLFRKNHSE